MGIVHNFVELLREIDNLNINFTVNFNCKKCKLSQNFEDFCSAPLTICGDDLPKRKQTKNITNILQNRLDPITDDYKCRDCGNRHQIRIILFRPLKF